MEVLAAGVGVETSLIGPPDCGNLLPVLGRVRRTAAARDRGDEVIPWPSRSCARECAQLDYES